MALLAVGDELLIGDVVNTNAAWLGRRFTEAGLDVVAESEVGDDVEAIAQAVHAGLSMADALVVTGGLGPTPDDLTRAALARAAGVGLHRDPGLAELIAERYRRRGRVMSENNLLQAELPEGATAIDNPAGTAPGIRLPLGHGVVYALPGVPHEMEAMVGGSVLGDLLALAGAAAGVASRTLRTAGLWEADVASSLAEVESDLAATGVRVAYLAGGGEVAVRLTARAADPDAARALLGRAEERVRPVLGVAVYGVDGDTLTGVLHAALLARGETVASAESLTGGLLGARLSETPGASNTFRGGVVVYATDTKATLAGVPEGLLEREGPVSARVAGALAEGARQRLAATYGLALTGVAGPDPQDGHPPGTVFAALSAPTAGSPHVRELALPGDRQRIRERAVAAALDVLRRHLAPTGG